jgi:hypothetical protein
MINNAEAELSWPLFAFFRNADSVQSFSEEAKNTPRNVEFFAIVSSERILPRFA